MANENTKSVLDEVLGDAAGVFTNPDPLNAMEVGMPSWMTDNLLDDPVFKSEPKKAAHPAAQIIEVRSEPDANQPQ